MRRAANNGFTLIELVMVVALIGVLAAIAAPALLRARQSGNEASAISSLRAVVTAQFMYGASCGSGFFAPSLSALGAAPAGGTPFVGPDLGGADISIKASYYVTVGSSGGADPSAPASCNGVAAGRGTVGYWVTATPAAGAGSHAYGSNTLTTIYTALQDTPLAMTDTTAPAGAVAIPQ
ncbi:MAG: type II secretion system protein [Acidobacteria bacterium]|nr:type II secretion system protein [Acidobacteriota bacterium]